LHSFFGLAKKSEILGGKLKPGKKIGTALFGPE
jgi:hypothetical protein